ncbi:hypothetical protein [Actinomadura sp. WMMB 499]|nr:hypothetical protein [Actinomadura sp. WMMB 499]
MNTSVEILESWRDKAREESLYEFFPPRIVLGSWGEPDPSRIIVLEGD